MSVWIYTHPARSTVKVLLFQNRMTAFVSKETAWDAT